MRVRTIALLTTAALASSAGLGRAAPRPVPLDRATARQIGAVALVQWFAPDPTLVDGRPTSALRDCARRAGGGFRCAFHYMPGNTTYDGHLVVHRMVRERPRVVRAHVVAHGTSLRLPPARPVSRRGTFRVAF